MKNKVIFRNKRLRPEPFFQSLLKRFIEKKLAEFASQYTSDETITAVFAHDFVGSQVNIYGVFERDDLEDLFLFLAPVMKHLEQGVALDVGANIGNHSIYFSKKFAKVFAYEPNPAVHQLLEFNSRNFNNIITNKYGLGEVLKHASLIEVNGNIGASSIAPDATDASVSIPIEIQTMDDVIGNIAEKITFIKIDVEGHEMQVLKGAMNTIKQHQPVIAFEQHQSEFCGGTTPSIEFLRVRGYTICWAEYPRERTKNSIIRELQKFLDRLFRKSPAIVSGVDIPTKSHSMIIAIPKELINTLGVPSAD